MKSFGQVEKITQCRDTDSVQEGAGVTGAETLGTHTECPVLGLLSRDIKRFLLNPGRWTLRCDVEVYLVTLENTQLIIQLWDTRSLPRRIRKKKNPTQYV